MIGKLRALGLVLVAVIALGALMASVASAGALTSTGKVKLSGSESEGTLTVFGMKVVCQVTYEFGNVGETPHGLISSGATTLTSNEIHFGCSSFIGETKAPSTFTTNGCDVVKHITHIIFSLYSITYDVVCPAGKEIEVHAYTSSAHTSTVCTVKIPAQTGLTGGTVETSGSNLKFGGPVKGMKATKTGILCGGTAETTTGEQDYNVIVTGKSEGGAATAVSITGA
jgi:hypothetical protein